MLYSSLLTLLKPHKYSTLVVKAIAVIRYEDRLVIKAQQDGQLTACVVDKEEEKDTMTHTL